MRYVEDSAQSSFPPVERQSHQRRREIRTRSLAGAAQARGKAANENIDGGGEGLHETHTYTTSTLAPFSAHISCQPQSIPEPTWRSAVLLEINSRAALSNLSLLPPAFETEKGQVEGRRRALQYGARHNLAVPEGSGRITATHVVSSEHAVDYAE